jgi:hypothetical protein
MQKAIVQPGAPGQLRVDHNGELFCDTLGPSLIRPGSRLTRPGTATTRAARVAAMASVHSESLPQRLAAIREQLQLLADYL